MEWASILPGIIAALTAAIGLPIALRKRKKSGPQNVEQFFHHLQEMGVKASLLERGAEEAKVGLSRASGQRSEGVIKIEGRNIDYINVISVTSQYGVRYFLDNLVKISNWTSRKNRKKTRMIKRRSSSMWGKVAHIEWKGDDYLARELNHDYQLTDTLLQSELGRSRGSISIAPEPKHEYARVRTDYLLPSPDLFEAIDTVARYIKSGW